MRASLEPSDLLTTASLSRPLVEVLDEPVTALLGVSAHAAAALANIGVISVFDLAMSRVFAAAVQLDDAADNAASALNRFGSAPSDLVNANSVGTTRVTDLRFEDLEVLAGIADPEGLQAALGVMTVRDLTVYPPFVAATTILRAAFFPDQVGGMDPEAPADLIPRSGEYPTERVQYTTLVLDRLLRPDNAPPLIDVASLDFAPIDVAPAAAPDFGFTTLGLGALLTINQSWFMQGVTLGHLLHSMALAPGESTRIAVVDWSRRTSAGQTEMVGEDEDVAQDTSRNRSISEVTQAVATEAQTGFSSTDSDSTTKQAGASVGLSIGPVGFGGSASISNTKTHAESYATTAGSREVGASMLQQAADRTQQHAHASRTRRASVVREVSQSEHEQVSTRVVTNYNHMHALSVQYYEVLQVYRTETSLVGCDRVVFVPFKLIDFSNEDVLKRFRGALIDAALTTAVRDALINYETLEIVPERKVRFPGLGGTLDEIVLVAGMARPAAFTGARVNVTRPPEASSVSDGADRATEPAPDRPAPVVPGLADVARALWSDAGRKATSVLGAAALRRGSESFFLPADVRIVEGRVESSAGGAITLTYRRADGSSIADLTQSIGLAEISAISLAGSSTTAAVEATATLTLARNGVIFPFELPTVTVQMGAAETRIVRIQAASADVNLVQHLNGNQLHYSQAAFRGLDAAMIAGLLAPFSIEINGETYPLVQVAEPTPLRIVGNALAFKINTDQGADDDGPRDAEWAAFMASRGLKIGEPKVDLVPLSSGGVFAEAILGRFNSAEKLDMTRFWNWQDSPIPITASDIAPVQLGSRAAAEDLRAGPLSAPIVSITPAAALPDPTGMTGALGAIQNGGMFRDMSGLAETVKLATEAIKASSAGATSVGAQASKNMEVAVNADTERQRIAAQLEAALKGKPLSDKNISEQGAVKNEVDKAKEAGGAGSKTPAPLGTPGGSGSPGSPGGTPGGGNAGPAKPPSGGATTREAPPASTGNVALDAIVGNGPLMRHYIGMSDDSPEPTKAVTTEGVPLLEWDIHGGGYSMMYQASGEPEPHLASGAEIADIVEAGWWKPTDSRDFRPLLLGDEHRQANSFGRVVLPISMLPAGSLKALNIVAHATGTNRLAFAEAFAYSKTSGDLRTEHIPEPVPLSTMDFAELLALVAGGPLQADGVQVQLADVRQAFPVDGEVRVFNLSNPLMPEYIQALANYFQVRTTGFTVKPVRVLAEVIAQTDPNDEPVLSSKVSVGFLGDPAEDVSVEFFSQLLNLDRSETGAYTAFPRR